MSNLLDYLDWRGDLTLAQDAFNEVDNLILAELSFVNFGGIVPGPGEGSAVPLHEAAEAYFARFSGDEKIDMGVLVPDAIPDMLRKMAASPRFRDMKLNCFVDWLDTRRAEQFAALTVETGDGMLYLAFRGTDDTLAGWKEDFNMSFMSEVPAQKMAVEYVQAVTKQYPRRKLRIGGHSKGGNLAVYASVFCGTALQRRILHVWSNDGPGFHDSVLSLPQYRSIADRTTFIIPKSSVVGMLLEHEEDYVVVDSHQQGLMQHDGFSWVVLGPGFVRLPEVSASSRINDKALKAWVRDMTLEQRERFVDGLFNVLESSGAVTLTDLKEDKLKAAGAMVQAMKDMDKETRDVLVHAVKLLLSSNLKVIKEEVQQEVEKNPKVRELLKKKEEKL